MKNKLYVIGSALHYAEPFKDIILINDITQADILLFTGGSDVMPDLYNEYNNKRTFSSPKRDLEEVKIFNMYKDKFKIGICRGSQFLTVMNKGKLVQHVTNHAINGTHSITTDKGEEFNITSTHHQMMFPFNLSKKDYKLVAWSTEGRSDTYEGSHKMNQMNLLREPEIVWYPKTYSLCIQGHPEMMEKTSKTVNYINDLIKFYKNGICKF